VCPGLTFETRDRTTPDTANSTCIFRVNASGLVSYRQTGNFYFVTSVVIVVPRREGILEIESQRTAFRRGTSSCKLCAPQSSRALPPRKRCSRWSRCHKDTLSIMCIDLRRNRCQGRSHCLHPLMETTVTRITQDGKEKNSYSKNVSRSSSSLSSGGVLR
jgi:hypothetical protein